MDLAYLAAVGLAGASFTKALGVEEVGGFMLGPVGGPPAARDGISADGVVVCTMVVCDVGTGGSIDIDGATGGFARCRACGSRLDVLRGELVAPCNAVTTSISPRLRAKAARQGRLQGQGCCAVLTGDYRTLWGVHATKGEY